MQTKAKHLYLSLAHHCYDIPLLLLLLLAETVLCTVIIININYTEIDWEAYMQEVDLWKAGELDYRKIRGGTGPLVYPAGFLYVYGWLQDATNHGRDIFQAQVYFTFLYVCNTTIVLMICIQIMRQQTCPQYGYHHHPSSDAGRMQQAHVVWSWRIAMGLCCLSKRIHSIFVLRLFNDAPAMLLLYFSILFFMNSMWKVGCVFFSLAVSIKMNILLFAPGLLLLLLQFPANAWDTVLCLGICASVQLILGAPFLLTYPESYIRKAFEFDRVFFYKWTVNWKFLSEETFVSKPLSIALLVMHLAVLAFFATQWLCSAKIQTSRRIFLNHCLSPEYIVYTMAVSNLVGIVFARTLHYQFYVWYFHTLPFLLWMTGTYPIAVRICLMGAIEYAFNVFPATPTSSVILQVAHLLILMSIRPPQAIGMPIVEEIGVGGDDVKKKA